MCVVVGYLYLSGIRIFIYGAAEAALSNLGGSKRRKRGVPQGHPIFYLARKTNIILLGGAPCDKRGHSYAWLHIRRMSHTGHWVDILLYII